jgi:hypothetical protein
MANVQTGYKKTYDHPNATGKITCYKCNHEGELPANYCQYCGNELEEHQKRGLKN